MAERQDIEVRKGSILETYENLPENIQNKLEWFKDQKLGVIFHWGLYAEAGIVESWQLSEEDEWARGDSPWRDDLDELRKDYWGLNKVFNPVDFDPEEWARQCRQAGFKYMIFSTKHHDGFNMYDTAYSDYKITGPDSPFHSHPKSDVFKEVTDAFRSEGLAVGAYYSKADWYSPSYWVPNQHAKGRTASYDPLEDPEKWNEFKSFVQNQLIEIAEKYGPIDITWLDAGWVREGRTHEDLDMDTIAEEMRKFNPDMLIVDRSVGGEHENYVTPERKIPEIAPQKAWESNIPHANNWGYVPDDEYKTDRELMEAIIKVVSMGGNLIIGIGPKPDGTLPERSVELLNSLEEFTGLFGEAIYSTRPFETSSIDDWYFTQNNHALYAFCIPEPDKPSLLDLTQVEGYSKGKITDLSNGKKAEINDQTLHHLNSDIGCYRIEIESVRHEK